MYSFIKKYNSGGLLDVDKMRSDLRSSEEFYRNGSYTASGRRNLAAIAEIEANQNLGLNYVIDDANQSFKIVDAEGNRVTKSEGRGVGAGTNVGPFYGLVNKEKQERKAISRLMSKASNYYIKSEEEEEIKTEEEADDIIIEKSEENIEEKSDEKINADESDLNPPKKKSEVISAASYFDKMLGRLTPEEAKTAKEKAEKEAKEKAEKEALISSTLPEDWKDWGVAFEGNISDLMRSNFNDARRKTTLPEDTRLLDLVKGQENRDKELAELKDIRLKLVQGKEITSSKVYTGAGSKKASELSRKEIDGIISALETKGQSTYLKLADRSFKQVSSLIGAEKEHIKNEEAIDADSKQKILNYLDALSKGLTTKYSTFKNSNTTKNFLDFYGGLEFLPTTKIKKEFDYVVKKIRDKNNPDDKDYFSQQEGIAHARNYKNLAAARVKDLAKKYKIEAPLNPETTVATSFEDKSKVIKKLYDEFTEATGNNLKVPTHISPRSYGAHPFYHSKTNSEMFAYGKSRGFTKTDWVPYINPATKETEWFMAKDHPVLKELGITWEAPKVNTVKYENGGSMELNKNKALVAKNIKVRKAKFGFGSNIDWAGLTQAIDYFKNNTTLPTNEVGAKGAQEMGLQGYAPIETKKAGVIDTKSGELQTKFDPTVSSDGTTTNDQKVIKDLEALGFYIDEDGNVKQKQGYKGPLVSKTGINTPLGKVGFDDLADLYFTLKDKKVGEVKPALPGVVQKYTPGVMAARDMDQEMLNKAEQDIASITGNKYYKGSDPIMNMISAKMASDARQKASAELAQQRSQIRNTEAEREFKDLQAAEAVGVDNANLLTENKFAVDQIKADAESKRLAAEAQQQTMKDANLSRIIRNITLGTEADEKGMKDLQVGLLVKQQQNAIATKTAEIQDLQMNKYYVSNDPKKLAEINQKIQTLREEINELQNQDPQSLLAQAGAINRGQSLLRFKNGGKLVPKK